MNIGVLSLCVLGGYLFGSLSIARLVTRLMAPGTNLDQVDLPDRTTGGTFTLKTVGATTASVLLGPKIGGLIGILDIVKGLLPSLLVRLAFPAEPYYLAAGIAVIVGHIWPIFYRFRGGGGLSPALGLLLVIDPLGTLVCTLAAMLLGMFVLREIVVIVMGGTWLMIPWVWLRTGDALLVGAVVFINLLLVVAVIPDVRKQLLARKMGTTDFSTSMDSIPMGREMIKLMKRFGVAPRGQPNIKPIDPPPAP